MAADLLACPFCGGAAEIMEDGTGCVVACTDCDTGTYNRHATRARAVAVWNRRAPIAAVPVVTGENESDVTAPLLKRVGTATVVHTGKPLPPPADLDDDDRATPPAAPVMAIVAAARAFDESYRLGWHTTGRDYHDDADRIAAAIAAAKQGGTDANMLEAIDRTLDASLVDRALADRVRDAAHGTKVEG